MNHLQYLGGLRRHYIVLPALGLGYGRIPKAANSMVKRLLAEAAGLSEVFGEEAYSQDRNWRTKAPHAFFLTAAEARRRFPGILLFSFVREPLSRLASCYRSKIVRPDIISLSLQREGLSRETTFADFVRHVCRRADWRSNIHYRAQAHILRGGDGLAPDFIGRIEEFPDHWRRLSEMIEDRGKAPLPRLPKRKRLAVTAQMKNGDLFAGDRDLIRMAKRRYAQDLMMFYPDEALSGARLT